jgi:5-formyltetrahydrofolate cyclo-ligase
MNKQELRKVFLFKRKSLSDAEWKSRSEQLAKLFFRSVDLSTVKFLHTFVPIKKNREPDTWVIIHLVQSKFADVTIALPKVNTALCELESFVYESSDDLKTNTWGIEEPSGQKLIDPSMIDLVLIPLLTFDKRGHRVGYGKGFYDKFLSQCRPDTKRVGISLFEGVDHIDDVDPLDQRLDICITPDEVVRF